MTKPKTDLLADLADAEAEQERLTAALRLAQARAADAETETRLLKDEVEVWRDLALREERAGQRRILDLAGERDALAAKIERVRALHQPVEVACWPCLASDCDHDDDEDCPTVNVPACGHCLKVVEEATGRDDVLLSRWPCLTIRALDESEG